jgi:hypothetical protein
MEKSDQNDKRRGSTRSPSFADEGALVSRREGLLKRIWDSFKRDPNASITRPAALGVDGKVFDVEAAAQRTASSPLARRLKGRHLQMIAIGGSIGEKHPANMPFSEPQTLTTEKRHRALRWIWQGPINGGTCLTRHRLFVDWYHAVLYRPCPRRVGSHLPSGRLLLRLLDSLHRPCMGLRNGVELCRELACYHASGNRLCFYHCGLLGLACEQCRLDHRILILDYNDKFLRRQGLRRS